MANDSAAITVPEVENLRKHGFGFRWFLPEIAKHQRVWFEILAGALAMQLLALATPLFFQIVIDKVLLHQATSTLTVVGTGLVAIAVFNAFLSWARQYLQLYAGNRIDAVLGGRVFGHLVRLPMRYFETRPTGTLIARIHGVDTLREFLTGASLALVLDLPMLIVFVAVMFYYSIPLTVIALGIVAALAVLAIGITPFLRARINRQFLAGARLQAFLTEYVGSMDTVKSLQLEQCLDEQYGGLLQEYLRRAFSTRNLSNTYGAAAGLLEQSLFVAVLWVGATHVMRDPGFTTGMLVAFQMFASRLAQPLMRLVGFWQDLQQARIAVDRLGDIMNAPAEPLQSAPQHMARSRGAIRVESLGFRYRNELLWLYRDLSMEIRPGECVTITGPSGCGKSTLARLLLGFYVPEEGRILIDDTDIRFLTADRLRSYFGVVPQETVLYSGSIMDNLQVGATGVSETDVMAVCKWVGLHEVITGLPESYASNIGERGVGLSGGQKQRLAIARALLKKPGILIFDEATSNLDIRSAEAVAETVNRLRGAATVIFIGHNIPVNLVADRHIELTPYHVGDELRQKTAARAGTTEVVAAG